MPSLLNMIPLAVGQSGPALVYAQVVAPAPFSFGGTMSVVTPDWSVDFPFLITNWPACHGATLPAVGDDVLIAIDNRGTQRVVWWGGTTLGAGVRPEQFGPGYGGAAADDWGPAITASLTLAKSQGTNVLLSGTTYGLRTTPVWPASTPSGNPSLLGVRGQTILEKLQDVTLLDYSGTLSNFLWWVVVRDVIFLGGDTSWTAPLVTNEYTENGRFIDCAWQANYGPAITARCAWDTQYVRPDIEGCGATDGVNPAVLIYSEAGDAGNVVNNQWFLEPRIEDWRTGAIWVVGADTGDEPVLTRLVGAAKIEQTGSSTMFGPAIKLVNTNGFMQDEVQFTCSGAIDSHQTTPLDAYLYCSGASMVSLDRMHIYWNATGSTSDLRSMFYLDASGNANDNISYAEIVILMNGTQPTSVFDWSTSYGNYNVARGTLSTHGLLTAPIDANSPVPGPLINMPSIAGASDTNFASSMGRPPHDGEHVYDTTALQEKVRIGGVWVPVGFSEQSTTGTTSGFAVNTGTALLSGSTFTGNTGSTAYTIGDVVRALKTIGVLAP